MAKKNAGVKKKKSRPRTFTGVRHDLDDFFKMTDALTSEDRCHYPFIVLTPAGHVVIERKGSGLATQYPPESNVLCQWPGKWRSDFFHFTVKEFRARWGAAKK